MAEQSCLRQREQRNMARCIHNIKRQIPNIVTFMAFLMGLYIMVTVDIALRENRAETTTPKPNPYTISKLEIGTDGSEEYLKQTKGENISKISEKSEKRNAIYQNRMNKACSELNQTRSSDLLYKPPVHSIMLQVDPAHNIYYCPVQKAGSTYWLRILDSISSQTNQNPYAVADINNLQHIAFVERWERRVAKPKLIELLSKRFAFLFVREPYDRLFSAYTDKIYYPNPDYWPSLTQDIARVVGRPNSTGHDITFAETIKYLLHMSKVRPKDIDMHFQTITILCNPCGIYYDFVGKMDDIKDDTRYLLNYISEHYPDVDIEFDNSDSGNKFDDIRRRTNALYNTMLSYKFPPEMSKYEIFERAWRNLQTRGYISKTETLPFPRSQAPGMDEATFGNVLINELKFSVKSDSVKKQKEEAFLQAYDSVPYSDLLGLQEMFKHDCDIFGYDCKPSKIFDRKTRVGNKSKFQYFKI